MRKAVVPFCILILCLVSACGRTEESELSRIDNPFNCSAELLYQKEEYVPQYAYEIDYHKVERCDFDIIIFGMNVAAKRIDYKTIMDTNRNFETIEDKENWEKTNESIYQQLVPLLSRKEIERLDFSTCNSMQFENVSYMLFTNDIEGGYECDLFKCENEKAVKHVMFEVSYQVMHSSDLMHLLMVFEDGFICVCDEIWFDNDLEPISKEKLLKTDYLLSKDEVADALKNTQVKELLSLAKDFRISQQDRVCDMEYCILLGDGLYLLEFDLQGNILCVICIKGPSETPATDFVPKKYDIKTNEYYDVKY